MSLGYVPFGFIDAGGKPAGFDVELANALAELLGAKVDIAAIPFPAQIPALASGRVKVAWSTFSVTDERLKQVDFVQYLKAGSVAIVLPKNAERFSKQNSLCGATVAVAQGSSGDFVLDKLNAECSAASLKPIKKAIYPDQRQNIQAAQTGRVDVWLDDSTVAGNFQKTSNNSLVVTGPNYYPLPLAIAVAKGDKETAEMLRAGLQTLIDNGTYKKLLTNYNLQDSAITKSEIFTSPEQLAH